MSDNKYNPTPKRKLTLTYSPDPHTPLVCRMGDGEGNEIGRKEYKRPRAQAKAARRAEFRNAKRKEVMA